MTQQHPTADTGVADTTPDGAHDRASDGSAPGGPRRTRFTDWIDSLGLVRGPGWIGGVAVAISGRTGLDVIVVRGILVVAAVLGAPVALLYAVAWLLLPDTTGQSHLQRLLGGGLPPAIVGIGVLVLLSFAPLTQGFWYAGSLYWGEPDVGPSIGRAVWTALLLAAAVVLVVWLARRSGAAGRDRPAAQQPTPDASGPAASAAAPTTTVPTAEPTAPTMPTDDASPAEFAEWHASQQEWKQHRAAWVAEQQRTEHERRTAAARARSEAFAAEAEERRRRRIAANPGVGAAWVFGTIGLALVAGALVALSQSETLGLDAWTRILSVGLAASAAVGALSLVVSGLRRRRNGFIGFLTVATLALAAPLATIPVDRQFTPFGAYTADGASTAVAGGSYVPLESGVVGDGTRRGDLWQAFGTVSYWVDGTVSARITIDSDERDRVVVEQPTDENGETRAFFQETTPLPDGRVRNTITIGDPVGGAYDYEQQLWLGRGGAYVQVNTPYDAEEMTPVTPTPAPTDEMTPVPTPTEEVAP